MTTIDMLIYFRVLLLEVAFSHLLISMTLFTLTYDFLQDFVFALDVLLYTGVNSTARLPIRLQKAQAF